MTVRKHVPVAAAMAALVVAGCNGGSDPAPMPAPPPPPVALELPANNGLIATADGPITVEPGQTARRGNVMISCPAGGAACVVNVMNVAGDANARAATYEATGGKPAVAPAMNPIHVPANHGLAAGAPITVMPGQAARHGNVDISCPAGGAACMVSVTGQGAFWAATGGLPAFAAASAALALPSGHGIAATGDAPIMVPAGQVARHGNVDISCPAGAACVVSVTGAGATFKATGGAPAVAAAMEALQVPANHGLADGMSVTVAAGRMARHGAVDISCPAGGAACVVSVTAEGAAWAATGGLPTIAAASVALALPSGHGLAATGDAPIIVAAGVTVQRGNVDISCPAGGGACVIAVMNVPGAADARSATRRLTGGAPTVTLATNAFPYLPFGHGLASVTVPAGDTHHGPRGVSLSCPAGGLACVVSVAEDGGVRYDPTGGKPEFATNEMILAANSGPDPDMRSDGGHAVGLVTRLGTGNVPRGTGGWRGTGDDRARSSTTTPEDSVPGATGEGGHFKRHPVNRSGSGNNGDIARSTFDGDFPEVHSFASWAEDALAPTFRLTVGDGAFVGHAGSLTIDTVDPASQAASLGDDWDDDWNGAILKAGAVGGTTAYAAVYSDIKRTVSTPAGGGGGRTLYLDLSLDGKDREQSTTFRGQQILRPAPTDTGRRYGRSDISAPADRLNLASDISANKVVRFTTIDPRVGAEEVQIEVEATRTWGQPIPVNPDGILADTQKPEGSVDVTIRFTDPNRPTETGYLTCVRGRAPRVSDCAATQRIEFNGQLEGVWQLVIPNPITPATRTDDKRYLTLGYWLALPEIADGAFDLGAFADGSTPYMRAELDALTGEASYRGPATGIYARGVYGNPTSSVAGRGQEPVVTSAQVGSFIATADLVARFGAAGDAPSMNGVVGHFMENGKPLGNWHVTLEHAAPVNDEAVLLRAGVAGAADGRRLTGQWGAEFFKSGEDTPHPGYAAGTFAASTEDEDTPQDVNALHIIGAFGATRQ